jgi:hypothetical protein
MGFSKVNEREGSVLAPSLSQVGAGTSGDLGSDSAWTLEGIDYSEVRSEQIWRAKVMEII